MKDRKGRPFFLPRRAFFCFTLLLVFFSAHRLFSFRESLQPKLVSSWRTTNAIEAVSGDSTASPAITVQEAVILPDQVLVFLKYPPSTPLFTKHDISCIYSLPNSSHPHTELSQSPESTDDEFGDRQIVRCPLPPRGLIVSLAVGSNGYLPVGPIYRWDSLAYEAMIDRDDTTIVFFKGFKLRGGRASDPSKFKCVYGWDLRESKHTLQSDVVSIAQEIARCQTPSSLLDSPERMRNNSIKVSVRIVGTRSVLDSVARPEHRLELRNAAPKLHEMCVCTMLRNQARFLHEWVMYHGRIGVERWFIYDNNSEDNIEQVVEVLLKANYNVTRHLWPWIKSQEAGFSHCALRARDSCEWVGFIDVDEFFHLPSGMTLHRVLRNRSMSKEIGEIRASCRSFGPSGLKKLPAEGVTVGYTCRMRAPERHKSIVRSEALNSTLINVVHHFHLRQGFKHANVGRDTLVINHYKYQVWEVFKEKFYRRVATYVSDWQQQRNVGSKDRTPGLGTRAVEPPDWASRFCEVNDTGLKDRVLKAFADPRTGNDVFLLTRPLLFSARRTIIMANEELFKSPQNSKNPSQKPGGVVDNGGKTETLFSPRFRSAAEMAGWDEEALLIASLIVEDTPDMQIRQKKRSDLPTSKTPPTNSGRKRRAHRRSPTSMPIAVLGLEDEEIGKNLTESKIIGNEPQKTGEDESVTQGSTVSSSGSAIPCMDRLREELSCAICLEICFEPSTTPCGHSFCKRCLRSAADKCGKRCPKCRQLISNGRSCTVNTVLWNTIQLLFPQEIEARKASGALNPREALRQSPARVNHYNVGNRNVELLNSPESEDHSPRRRIYHTSRRRSVTVRPSGMLSRGSDVVRRRNQLPNQDEDAALALRLQRQEFMEVFSGSDELQQRSCLTRARENLRAMATRAASFRSRGRTT